MGKLVDGRWEILRTLGQGGQGQALLVRDTKSANGEEVVLKQLLNKQRVARLQKEVDAFSRLEHPNVLRLIDSNLTADRPYLVTEYCPGGTLEDNKSKLLETDRDDRVGKFEQICAGVEAIHAKGIVHRDLKPANIFLRKDGTPVVGDLGLAFIEDTDRPTETSEAIGARWYMAPELAEGRLEDVTPRADVYSLGKIFYWLLTGSVFDRERHRLPKYDLLNLLPMDESLENVGDLPKIPPSDHLIFPPLDSGNLERGNPCRSRTNPTS